ncbi:hypothetical protein NGM37_40520, partial [Streptomyces sp. TRM76130]|nr:hypothetical protein [Streptomyces sp. TRM76130]
SADPHAAPDRPADASPADPDAHWRAADQLSVGRTHLTDDPPLIEEPRPGHVTPRLLGHGGPADGGGPAAPPRPRPRAPRRPSGGRRPVGGGPSTPL